MATMMSTAAASMTVAPQLASGSAVAFNNGGVRTNMVVSRRSAGRMVVVRAMADDKNLGDEIKDRFAGAGDRVGESVGQIKSSTGELNPFKAKAAEEDNPDGTNVIDKLKDAGRTLKSKTNDVVEYGAKRNASEVDDNVTQKNIKEQSEYTKGL